jgi:NitT/TauT family transport system permease protein
MSRAVPHLFTRLKVAAKIVPRGVIIGAVVITQGGISHLILSTSSMGETALVFAALLVLCLIGLALYAAVVLADAAYGGGVRASG